ncbi:hypothetical protein P1X14_18530 [Sphingomonas sp. AOB5]|uniref:hypothetical protein n=1 Tax=Sphingomonas sp. AOB5 TaxID=3034017 RepID=UPI0023F976EC|nr:hypothetical protein [Sphingomonas sp. AOB5]MDF7777263.1 hypothetical protein [Sphingomonas sp. AOB5]
MRHMILIAALAVCAVPAAAHAQPVSVPSSGLSDAIVEPFFQALKQGDVALGLKRLTQDAPRLAARVAESDELPKQIEGAIRSYGAIQSWEQIETVPLGTMLRRDTWLVQHRDFVTRWRFIYVRTAAGWTLTSFVFDDQAPSWFD